MDFYSNEIKTEKALLVAIDNGEYDVDASIAELGELAKTAGAEVLGEMIQKKDSPNSATFVGTGRLEEISEFCRGNDIDLVIVDDELTPTQIRNIEDKTGVRVVDRTTLILDIFASRARSSEGKIQVELAQLKYSLPRLSGKGTALSRLGGGIGTRGPGETKLESDKRHIRRRIQNLNEELKEVEKRRSAMHERRKKNNVLSVAIVGYTNAGKSTLMNYLTNAGVLAQDKLFATLDPTARKLVLPNSQEIMIIDTVGLVRRLPHQLVDAFRSTLEEALWADVILNVSDASSPECAEHIEVTNKLLESLGCKDKPIINVLNKCDLAENELALLKFGHAVEISALTGAGIDELLDKIEKALPKTKKEAELLIPFDKGQIVGKIRKDGIVLSEEYEENGTKIRAILDIAYLDTIKDYII